MGHPSHHGAADCPGQRGDHGPSHLASRAAARTSAPRGHGRNQCGHVPASSRKALSRGRCWPNLVGHGSSPRRLLVLARSHRALRRKMPTTANCQCTLGLRCIALPARADPWPTLQVRSGKACHVLAAERLQLCVGTRTVGYPHDELLDLVPEHVAANIRDYSPQDLSNTCWAFARLQKPCDAIFRAILAESLVQLWRFQPQKHVQLDLGLCDCSVQG